MQDADLRQQLFRAAIRLRRLIEMNAAPLDISEELMLIAELAAEYRHRHARDQDAGKFGLGPK